MILDGFSPSPGQGTAGMGQPSVSSLRRLAPEDRWILSRVNSCALQVDAAMEECQLHRATRCPPHLHSRGSLPLVCPAGQTTDVAGRGIGGKDRCLRDNVLRAPEALQHAGPLHPSSYRGNVPEYPAFRRPGKRPHDRLVFRISAILSIPGLNARWISYVPLMRPRPMPGRPENGNSAGRSRECIVVTGSDEVVSALEILNAICRERANARAVRVIRGRYDRIGWRAEPVMKALGPAFGKNAPLVRDSIRATDAASLKEALDQGTPVMLETENGSFEITPGQVTFAEELPPGLFQAPMDGGIIYVDVTLSPTSRPKDIPVKSSGVSRRCVGSSTSCRGLYHCRSRDC